MKGKEDAGQWMVASNEERVTNYEFLYASIVARGTAYPQAIRAGARMRREMSSPENSCGVQLVTPAPRVQLEYIESALSG